MRYTLLGRAAKTFEAYLAGPVGPMFRGDEFRDALARELAVADRRQKKAFATTFLLTAIIIFFEALQSAEISIGFVHLKGISAFKDAFIFLQASSCLGLAVAFLDYVLLQRYLDTIYFTNKVWFPRLFYMHIYSSGIHNDLFVPRYYGLKSTKSHKASFIIVGLIATGVGAVIISVCFLTAISSGLELLTSVDKPLSLRTIGAISIILGISSPLMLILGLCVPMRFSPADFDETTQQPTAEFAERIRRESEAEDAVA